MKPSEFNRKAALTRLDPLSVDLARRVLIDGDIVSQVALEAGLSRQCVYGYINRIKAADKPKIGAGLARISIRRVVYYVPHKDADRFEAMIKSMGG